MTVGAGGAIKQVVVRDNLDPYNWDVNEAIMFNVQLIDATSFKHTLGIDAPKTPITAATYAEHGYPFFKLYKQASGIYGEFDLKSVGLLDKKASKNIATHKTETALKFPTISLAGNGSQIFDDNAGVAQNENKEIADSEEASDYGDDDTSDADDSEVGDEESSEDEENSEPLGYTTNVSTPLVKLNVVDKMRVFLPIRLREEQAKV